MISVENKVLPLTFDSVTKLIQVALNEGESGLAENLIEQLETELTSCYTISLISGRYVLKKYLVIGTRMIKYPEEIQDSDIANLRAPLIENRLIHTPRVAHDAPEVVESWICSSWE